MTKSGELVRNPIGINTISQVPQEIAQDLGLLHAAKYTGHTFRRSMASVMAAAGASKQELIVAGWCESESVAQGYIESGVAFKK